MILATHAISGAVLAELVPNHKVAAFCVGFVSHFILDAVPHWDYKLSSLERDENDLLNTDMKMGKEFAADLLKTGADAAFGLVLGALLAYFIFRSVTPAIFFGAIGGLFPDFLQFVYMKWKHEPMVSLQKTHIKVHAREKIRGKFFGLAFQAVIVILLGAAVFFAKAFLA